MFDHDKRQLKTVMAGGEKSEQLSQHRQQLSTSYSFKGKVQKVRFHLNTRKNLLGGKSNLTMKLLCREE